MQWFHCILPRIHSFVPTATILEIAPGHGRWTQFLKDLCQQLHVVDLSATCIAICRERFSEARHIDYHINDGRSLRMIADNSVDFIFSFDSLVHAEAEVMEAYVREIARIATSDAVAFIHHSNVGAYDRYYRFMRQLRRVRGTGRLFRWRILDDLEAGWRAPDMSAERMKSFAAAASLHCIAQERITWDTRSLSDCFSVLTPRDSRWARPTRELDNPRFTSDADVSRQLSQLYSVKSLTSAQQSRLA
jgi:hypothetical protein